MNEVSSTDFTQVHLKVQTVGAQIITRLPQLYMLTVGMGFIQSVGN